MRNLRIGIGAALATGIAVTLAVVGLSIGAGESGRNALAAAPTTASEPVAVPAYAQAMSRSQTADERDVQRQTPASNTRSVMVDGADAVYVGRVEGQDALCISIQQRQTQRLTTTCGDASSTLAGDLRLVRGGADGQDVVIVGVAPPDSASATAKTASGDLVRPIAGGIFLVRSDNVPAALEFKNAAGVPVKSVTFGRLAATVSSP
jgi:hypothetical protein